MMSSVICCVCFVPRAHRPARRDCAVVSRVPAYRSAIRTYRYRIPLRIPRSISNGTVERGPVPRSASYDVVSIAGFCFWCRPDRG